MAAGLSDADPDEEEILEDAEDDDFDDDEDEGTDDEVGEDAERTVERHGQVSAASEALKDSEHSGAL